MSEPVIVRTHVSRSLSEQMGFDMFLGGVIQSIYIESVCILGGIIDVQALNHLH